MHQSVEHFQVFRYLPTSTKDKKASSNDIVHSSHQSKCFEWKKVGYIYIFIPEFEYYTAILDEINDFLTSNFTVSWEKKTMREWIWHKLGSKTYI